MISIENRQVRLRRKINIAIIITIIGLLLNGVSAVPLIKELNILLSKPDALPKFLLNWWMYVDKGVNETTRNYPFMRYGFDWLGFAHLLIAIAFIGPLKNPVKNEWVVQWGMIVSALSVLMAFGFERFRGIPLWWSCIDAFIAIVAFNYSPALQWLDSTIKSNRYKSIIILTDTITSIFFNKIYWLGLLN